MAMTEVERITDQLERAFSGEAWHGPSLTQILQGIDTKTASLRPLPRAHTIWEIVRHITAWDDEVRKRLEGADAVMLPDERDWPAVGPDSAAADAAWQSSLDELRTAHGRLKHSVSRITDDQLDEALVGESDVWSRYRTLHGIVQHDLYHAGQIALLKKAIEGATS